MKEKKKNSKIKKKIQFQSYHHHCCCCCNFTTNKEIKFTNSAVLRSRSKRNNKTMSNVTVVVVVVAQSTKFHNFKFHLLTIIKITEIQMKCDNAQHCCICVCDLSDFSFLFFCIQRKKNPLPCSSFIDFSKIKV